MSRSTPPRDLDPSDELFATTRREISDSYLQLRRETYEDLSSDMREHVHQLTKTDMVKDFLVLENVTFENGEPPFLDWGVIEAGATSVRHAAALDS